MSTNRKGILAFLAITFGITYLAEIILILSGFRFDGIPAQAAQLVVAAVMWVPAAAALITIRFITREKTGSILLRFGPSWKPYLATALLIPLAYVVIYGLTWLLGLGAPDWQLTSLYALIASSGADMSAAPEPSIVLTSLLFVSLLVAPFLNSLFGFGEELGWRGFLLPRLLPLGKWKAYLLLGVIWGLWHAPLIAVGFNYPGSPVLGIGMMVLLTTALGIFINELTLRYQSAILAGWVHGVFNSQAYGIWRTLLFADTNPLIGGVSGIVGIVVLAMVGLATMRWLEGRNPGAAQAPKANPNPA